MALDSRRRDRLDAALRERLGPVEYRRLYLRMLAATRAFDTLTTVAPDIAAAVMVKKKRARKPQTPPDVAEIFAALLSRLPDQHRPAKASLQPPMTFVRNLRLVKR